MAGNTLSILKPSVNNLTVRIFVRAAGLEFEELDVWGKKSTPEFLSKDPADLTPLLEEEGLPKGALWESCAIMQYLCNKHGLDQFYPRDPGERAMVDSAMFYLIGTVYPLLARATYPTLGFAQYAGEAATSDADDAVKAKAAKDAEAALAGPLEVYNTFFLAGRKFIGGDNPSIADMRFAATLEFLRAIDYDLPSWAEDYIGNMEDALGEAMRTSTEEPAGADVRHNLVCSRLARATSAPARLHDVCAERLRPRTLLRAHALTVVASSSSTDNEITRSRLDTLGGGDRGGQRRHPPPGPRGSELKQGDGGRSSVRSGPLERPAACRRIHLMVGLGGAA